MNKLRTSGALLYCNIIYQYVSFRLIERENDSPLSRLSNKKQINNDIFIQ